MKAVRKHATYANVVATLALFIAVSTGGAWAASQLSANSVGKKQLKKSAVTSRAVKNGGIATRDLSARTLRRLSVERANVADDGTLASGTATSAAPGGAGEYTVSFDREVADCTYSATPAPVRAGATTLAATARITGQGGKTVTVSTSDIAGNPVASGFHLLAAC